MHFGQQHLWHRTATISLHQRLALRFEVTGVISSIIVRSTDLMSPDKMSLSFRWKLLPPICLPIRSSRPKNASCNCLKFAVCLLSFVHFFLNFYHRDIPSFCNLDNFYSSKLFDTMDWKNHSLKCFSVSTSRLNFSFPISLSAKVSQIPFDYMAWVRSHTEYARKS